MKVAKICVATIGGAFFVRSNWAHFFIYYKIEECIMAKICPICGEKIGFLLKAKASNGDICSTCAMICSSHETKSIETLKDYWKTNSERERIFIQTQLLTSFNGGTLSIDSTHELFAFGNVSKAKVSPVFYRFDEVDSYEVEIVGQKTITKKRGGITRALVGGALAGGVGAIVGSNTAKEETKTVGGTQILRVNMVTYAGKCQHISIPSQNVLAFLDECLLEKDNSVPQQSSASSADEIMKYKALLDQGIISQEEFDAMKKQLLGL